ncbi:hypothetical protein [Nakamurella leprariae]|uniref:DUF3558 domain-containing protein n=1 Tax=Nakamurella leprariae TaxID=2803911 RepID=A0A939C144_9ACTN|nr:hypothetical protein [Nakamurella leprariae]MBM9466797.1 hypothetical protein [Nakamurella leprariae]
MRARGRATVPGRTNGLRGSIAATTAVVALLLSACGSGTGERRTVTVNETVTAASTADTAAAGATDGTAPDSTGAPATDSSAPATTPATPSTTSSSAAPTVQVDPLTNDCAALMNAADVKRTLNADIADTRARIQDVANPDRGVTGRIKCLYGTADNKSGDVTILLTQYTDAAAATAQVAATVTAERDLGAKVAEAQVQGFGAEILLRDGGLIVLPYDSWTLSIVVAGGKADDATLEAGLPQLADTVLTRVLKNT